MSNDCAVDLVLVREWSMRIVTSGSARHSGDPLDDVLGDLDRRPHA